MQIPRRALARRSPRSGARPRAGAGSRRWGLLALTLLLCVAAGADAAESGATAFPDPWVGNGPFGGGGPVQADPNAPGRLYLFAPDGPYQSDNHGSSWAPTTAIAGNTPFVYAPSDPTRAYRIDDLQLFSSHDAGATWAMVATLAQPGGHEAPLAIDPTDADVVYASIMIGAYDHLAVSRDGGLSWTTIDQGIDRVPPGDYSDGGLLVAHVFVDPTDLRHLIIDAGTGQWESGDDGATWHRYAAVSDIASQPGRPTQWTGLDHDHQAVMSDDGGQTWRPLPLGARPIGSLVSSPARPGVIYALVSAGQWDGGLTFLAKIERSTDDGLTWTSGATLRLGAGRPVPMSLDPLNDQRLFIVDGNRQLLRSIDGGVSWQRAVTGVPESNVTDIAPQPYILGAALAAADGNLQATADGGRHWVMRPAPDDYSLQIERSPADPSLLFDLTLSADRSVTSLFRSGDDGATWDRLSTPYADCWGPLAAAGGVLYLGCNDEGLMRSGDNGVSWSSPGPLPPNTWTFGSNWFAVDPHQPATVYVATSGEGLFRSSDGGASWRLVERGIAYPQSIAFSATDPDIVYVAGFGWVASQFHSLLRSDNGGVRWRVVDTPGNVAAVTVGPNGVVYASMRQTAAGGTIMASPDGGATWTDISNGAYAQVAAVSGSPAGRLWTIGNGGVHSRPGLAWTGPRPAGPITVRLTRGATLINGGVPVTLHWPAANDEASPICKYRVEARLSNQSWTRVGSATTATHRGTLARPGRATSYRVQAVACSGAESRWLAGPTIVPHVIQENAAAIQKQGPWRRVPDRRDSGGAQLVALGAGAGVSFHGANVTDIAYLATTGPAGGWPRIRIGLAPATLVSLHSAIVHHRRLAYVHHLPEPGTVSLTIQSGGASQSRTTLDAIITLRTLPTQS